MLWFISFKPPQILESLIKNLFLSFLGIVKFHQCNMAEFESNSSDAIDTQSLAGSTVSLLDQYVGDVRESMGVEGHDPSNGQTK